MADWEMDPEGSTEQVAVIMKGEVYRSAGLKHSDQPDLEGELYDFLCNRKSVKPITRDEVRRMAQDISIKLKTEFNANINWLDDFMRRFCLSKKKTGFYSKNMLKIKGKKGVVPKVKGRSSSRHNEADDDIKSITPSKDQAEQLGSPEPDANEDGGKTSSASDENIKDDDTSKNITQKDSEKDLVSVNGKDKSPKSNEKSTNKNSKTPENNRNIKFAEKNKDAKTSEKDKKSSDTDEQSNKKDKSTKADEKSSEKDKSTENDKKNSDTDEKSTGKDKKSTENDANSTEKNKDGKSPAKNKGSEKEDKLESKSKVFIPNKTIDKSSKDKDESHSKESLKQNKLISDKKSDSSSKKKSDETNVDSKIDDSNATDGPMEVNDNEDREIDEQPKDNDVETILSDDDDIESKVGITKVKSNGIDAMKSFTSGNDSTIVLDSDDEDDLQFAAAVCDAVIAEQSVAVTGDDVGSDDLPSLNPDLTNQAILDPLNILQSSSLQSPPRFTIKVRSMADLISTPPLAGSDNLLMASMQEKREPGRSSLMSLHKTTTNTTAKPKQKTVAEEDDDDDDTSIVKVDHNKKIDITTDKTKPVCTGDGDNKKEANKKNDLNDEDKENKKKEQEKSDDEEDGEKEESEGESETTTETSSDSDNSQSDDEASKSAESGAGAKSGNSDEEEDTEAAQNKKWKEENAVTYTKKEDKYYRRKGPDLLSSIATTMLHCTGCSQQINHHIQNLVFTHPCLGVLICKRCRKFYGKGAFHKDSEGLDEYCRWCANGGDLMVCDKCTHGFCKGCVRRNLGRSEITLIEKSKEWSCYVCDPSPLYLVRLQHRVVMENLSNIRQKQSTKSRTEKNKAAISNKFAVLKNQRRARESLTPKKSSKDNDAKSTSSTDDESENTSKETKTKKTKDKEASSKSAKEKETSSSSKTAKEKETSSSSKTAKNKTEKDKGTNSSSSSSKGSKETENDSDAGKEESDTAPWLNNCMTDLTDMLEVCMAQVGRVQSKWHGQQSNNDTARMQCSRRLLRLMRAMTDNFEAVEVKFLEKCGDDRQHLVKVLEGINEEQEPQKTTPKKVKLDETVKEAKAVIGDKILEKESDDNGEDDNNVDDNGCDNDVEMGGDDDSDEEEIKEPPVRKTRSKSNDVENSKDEKETEIKLEKNTKETESSSEEKDSKENEKDNARLRRSNRRNIEEQESQSKEKENEGRTQGKKRNRSEAEDKISKKATEDLNESPDDCEAQSQEAAEECSDDEKEKKEEKQATDKNNDKKSKQDESFDDESKINNTKKDPFDDLCKASKEESEVEDSENEKETTRRSARVSDKREQLNYKESDSKGSSNKRKRKSTTDEGEPEDDEEDSDDWPKRRRSKRNKLEEGVDNKEEKHEENDKDIESKSDGKGSKKAKGNEDSDCEADSESDDTDKDGRKARRKSRRSLDKQKIEQQDSDNDDDEKSSSSSSRTKKRSAAKASSAAADDDTDEEETGKKKSSSKKKNKKDKDVDSDEFEKRKKAYMKKEQVKKSNDSSDEDDGEDEAKANDSTEDMFASCIEEQTMENDVNNGSGEEKDSLSSPTKMDADKHEKEGEKNKEVDDNSAGCSEDGKETDGTSKEESKTRKSKRVSFALSEKDTAADSKKKDGSATSKKKIDPDDVESGEEDEKKKSGESEEKEDKKKKLHITGTESSTKSKSEENTEDSSVNNEAKKNLQAGDSEDDSSADKTKKKDEDSSSKALKTKSNKKSDNDEAKKELLDSDSETTGSKKKNSRTEKAKNKDVPDKDSDEDGSKKKKSKNDEAKKDLLDSDSDDSSKKKSKSKNDEAKKDLLDSDSDEDSSEKKKKSKSNNDAAKKDLLDSDSDKDSSKKKSKSKNDEAKKDLLDSDSDEDSSKKKSKSKNDEAKKDLLDSDSNDDSSKKVKKSKSKTKNDQVQKELVNSDSEKENSKKNKKSKNDEAKDELLDSDSGKEEGSKKKNNKAKSKKDNSSDDSDASITAKTHVSKRSKTYGPKSKCGGIGKDQNTEKAEDLQEEVSSEFDSEDDDPLGIGNEDEEDSDEKSPIRIRPKAGPKVIQKKRQEKQLKKQKPVVVVKRLKQLLLDGLAENNNMLPISECQMLSRKKKNKSSLSSKKETNKDEDSDAEFTSLMKFKLKKKLSSKNANSSDDENEEDEEENDNKDGDNGKSDEENVKKEKKKKGERKSKEGLLDISLEGKDENEEEEEGEDEVEKKENKIVVDPSTAMNDKMKKNLLLSSDEEKEAGSDDSEDSTTKRERTLIEEDMKRKYDLMKARQKKKDEETKQENGEEEDDEPDRLGEESDEEKPKAKGKKGYMSLKFSSDEDEGEKKDGEDEEKEGSDNEDKGEEEEESDDSDYSDFESTRKARLFIDSGSDSDFCSRDKRKKNKKRDPSTESDDSDSDSKSKKSRKRIRKRSSSSSDGGDNKDEEDGGKTDDTPSKRKVRRIIRDEDLTESTKTATQQEEDRRSRIKDKQQMYNKIFEIDVETDQTDLTKLVLDFDPDTKKELISVHPKLVPLLKPHQVKGIKFMWDSTCESVQRTIDERGSGAILAHCMGLGKTLQVIVFVHTLLTCKRLENTMKTVLVLCPVNTVYNWVAEFKKWLKGRLLPFDVVEMISAKDLWNRAYRLDEWHTEKGICIMGYDMYRTLSNEKHKKYKGKMREIFQKTLVNPGPDFVVCDEGHILKNEKTAMAVAVNKVRTARRVVLTGTPLQNNLKEYHCMIQFVKPSLLGTRKEFMNRFVNPIQAGSCADATPRDVKRMKRRAHILHNLLEGCVQRFDYTVLQPFLPPKLEYVISVQMSTLQCKLYSYYLANLAQGGPKRVGSGLFVDFNNLSRVWTHPKVLNIHSRRALMMNDSEDDEMEDFICDDSTSSDEDDGPSKKKKKNNKESEESEEKESKPTSPEEAESAALDGLFTNGKVRPDWWKKIVSESVDSENLSEDEWMNKIELGGKLVLLLDILRECCGIGDKVLLFSQSIMALDMIEEFLSLIDRGKLEMPSHKDSLPLQYKYWKKERDYLRLDGSVSADIRKNQCKYFNEANNERCRLFLISTRAGGIGINLVAANRVILFDSSWNPAHDTQSIFRVYRFGQKKPCYVYRFVAQGSMEEKIYSRQVNKLSTSLRVVDEHQIKRYFNTTELADLYEYNPAEEDVRETPIVPEDRLLAEMIIRHKKWIVGYHEHDSLLENQTSEELSEEERKAAWEDFENEKKGIMPQTSGPRVNYGSGNQSFPTSIPAFDINQVIQSIYSQNPNLTPQQLQENVVMATRQIQKIHLNHYQRVQSYVYNLKNPMIAPEMRAQLPYGNQADVLPLLESQLSVLEDNIRRENQVIAQMQPSQPSKAALVSAGVAYGSPSTSATAASSSRNNTQYVDRSKASSSGAKSNGGGTVNRALPSSSRGVNVGGVPAMSVGTANKTPMNNARNKNKNAKGAEIVTLE